MTGSVACPQDSGLGDTLRRAESLLFSRAPSSLRSWNKIGNTRLPGIPITGISCGVSPIGQV